MPTYGYRCQNCQHEEDVFQKITDEPLKTCPKCHQDKLQRGPGGGIGLSFTGTGFYITDYGSGKKSESEGSTSEKPSPTCCPCGKKQSCSSV